MLDEIVFDPATTGEGAIVPEARYTLELIGMEKAPPSDFNPEAGPRVKWIFAIYTAAGERFEFNGGPYEFYRHTSKKNSPRAHARQYAEALLGRPLQEGETPPIREMMGCRMSALISYDDNPNDPSRQTLKMTSLKHVPVASKAKAAPAPAPTQVTADAVVEDVDRALAITVLGKQVARTEKLKTPNAKTFREAFEQIGTATDEQIAGMTMTVQGEIDKARAALAALAADDD